MKVCQEAQLLLEKLDGCAELYAESVRSLAHLRSTTTHTQYVELLDLVDHAREKCDRARAEIDKHTDSHGCFLQRAFSK